MTANKCSARVPNHDNPRDVRMYPCQRAATVERDGKWYCWQHDPVRVKEEKDRRYAEYQVRMDRKAKVRHRQYVCSVACEQFSTAALENGVIADVFKLLKDLQAKIGTGGDLDYHLRADGYAERIESIIAKTRGEQ